MKNAGIYVRVSTEHQAREGYSVSAQKNNMTKFAKDNNFNIYSIYSDEGISGKNIGDRPEVKRLINDIELKLIEVVLIYKFDRLTRNVSDTEDFIKIIQKYDITIYTLSEGAVDVSTPQGRFITRLKGAVAQLEREQTAERIKVAFVQKVKDGYSLCSATTCYGYNRQKAEKIMTINQEEAQVVKRIFKMYLNNYTFTKIAKTLNNEHIPTKMYGREVKIRDKKTKQIIGARVVNSVWQPKMIRLILSNPTYIGKVRYGIGTKQYFEANGHHKSIINEKIWKKAQDKLCKIKHISKTKLPNDDVYYCGTLACGVCGKKLTTTRTMGKLRKDGTRNLFNGYRCVNREKGTCTALGMSHDKVEKAFLKYLEQIEEFNVIDELVIDDETDVLKEEITDTKKAISNANNKLKEVMNMFMANVIDHVHLSYMLNELKDVIKINNEKLKGLQFNCHSTTIINKNDIAKKIIDHWKYLTANEKLTFLTDFVEKIVIVNSNSDRHNGDVDILDVKFYDYKQEEIV